MSPRYFDNAATSHPKPPAVAEAMLRYMTDCGAPARGVHAPARHAARLINQCRTRIARLVNLTDSTGNLAPDHVIFTLNTSDALNLAVKGTLNHARRANPTKKLHVVSTVMEHNSIHRPLHAMMRADPNLEITHVEADPHTGLIDPGDLRSAIKPNHTVLICINHASNVTGTIQDIESLGQVCAEFGTGSDDPNAPILLIDAAQSLGHIPVDMRAAGRGGADLLAFPGHKGLLGPTGTGGLCIRPGIESRLDTIREGGTGSASEELSHPTTLPDKYEPGSHNTLGIIGLSEGVNYILDRTVEDIRNHEIHLLNRLFAELQPDAQGICHGAPGLRLLGPTDINQRVGVLSFVHDELSPQEFAAVLEASYNILTRAGLHCAPLVHDLLGTSPATNNTGAVRLSLGPFLTIQDIDYAAAALATICREHRSAAQPAAR